MSGVSEKVSWRGERHERRPVVRHRWQREQPVGGGSGGPSRRGWRMRVALWLAIFLIAMGLFVYFLLFSPIQTPVVAVVAGPYQWPFPPNAWAREDLDRVASLDGQTLAVADTSAAWRSVDEGLRELEQQLRASRKQAIASGVVVLTISMHGAVDAAGTPCLIPPHASPHDTRTWLPVRRVLDVVRRSELPPDVHKLVIFDAGRMLVNWNIGLLDNSFADRLEEVVAEADVPNLVVLNSTGPGQRGWSSPELQGSVFGYYLRRGLAGAADGVLNKETNDRRVSLHELHAYLRRNVDTWVRGHRGARQQPLLIPSNTEDFQVAWSLNRWRSRTANLVRTAPAVSPADVTQLWRGRDALPAGELERFDPIAWHQLQHDLLWLEEAASAGRGYAALAQQTHANLKSRMDRLERIERHASATADLRSAASSKAGDHGEPTSLRVPVHQLPLAALLSDAAGGRRSAFGHSDDQSVTAARAALAGLRTLTTVEDLNAALRALADKTQLHRYDQIHFAQLLNRHRIPQLWQTPGLMAAVFKTRGQAARAGINEDERVQFWTAAPLASADAARRGAEDLLFLGPHATKDDPSTAWNRVAKHYAGVEKVGEDIAESLHIRDRGWATTPYLAQWLLHPLHWDGGTHDVEETLLPLIGNLHQLSRALAAVPDGTDPQSTWPSQRTETVRQQLNTLNQEFQNSVRSLMNATRPSAEACREIVAVLDVPLLTAEQREHLRQKLIDFSSQLAGTKPSATAEPATLYGARLAAFDTHPALAMLDRSWLTGGGSADGKNAADKPERKPRTSDAGQRIRILLATLPAEFQAWWERLTAPTKGGQRQAFPFRAGWPSAELARIAASFSLPELESDPVEHLRKLDLQRLLLRQSQRVLDDFYGPAAAGQQPFFEIAAEDYLQAAETIVEPTPETKRRLSALRTLLEVRSRAARTALRTAGNPILLVDQTADVTAHLSVQASASGAAEGLPTGRAAVFLRDEQARIAGSTHPLDVPLADTKAVELDSAISGASFRRAFPKNSSSVAKKGAEKTTSGNPPETPSKTGETPSHQAASVPGAPVSLSAVTLFRGNEFTSPVPVTPPGGYLVEYTSKTFPSASVTLSGTARQQLSVVFVLDCSSSMSESVQVEAPREGNQPGQRTRMAVAKDALTAMLDRLANQGNARVGVLFYGHRVGWSTAEPVRILRQTGYGRKIPDGLSPNRDVEAIQHLGRFDAGIAAEIENLLPSVKPWGQTPLYYALVQALGDFANEDPDTKKLIIVITDGLNYQYNDPDPTSQSDVLAAWSRQRVPIYIVGFGIPADDVAEAYEQFTKLAEQTGGDYRTPAVSATSLINSVESLLSSSRYRIMDSDGKAVAAADLGASLVVDSLTGAPAKFVVESDMTRQPITLWGGEALKLKLDKESDEIRSVDYDEGNPTFVDLVTGAPPRPSGFVLGVQRPLRKSQGVRFTVSVQRADSDFTPRPAEAWIEITPLFSSGDRTGQPVVFFHQHFEPRKPVPVLSWDVAGWPAKADRASIRFWCKPEATDPSLILDAQSLLDGATQADGPLSSPALEGITLTAHRVDEGGAAVLQVVEQHSVEAASFDPLMITAVLEQVRPERATRRIDPEHRLVVHRFTFDGIGATQLADVRLRITTRDDLQQDAWHEARPIEVEISDINGLIEPAQDPDALRPRLLVE